MNTPHDDQLTQLLRQWAERQIPVEEEVDWLQARIEAAISDDAIADSPTSPPPPRRSAIRGQVTWFSVGVAATLLLVASVWLARRAGSTSERRAATGDVAAMPSLISDSQLEGKTVLLSEMERLFPERLAWIAEDGQEVRVGLAEGVEKTSAGLPIAVRVVVLARKVGTEQWKPAWNLDVLTHGEQTVEVVPPGCSDEKFQIWALPLADGMVAVDSTLAVNGSDARQWSFSGVQKAGTPNRTFTLTKGDVEYEVFQTVALLKGKVG